MGNESLPCNDMPLSRVPGIQIVYNGVRRVVSNVTEAFVFTVQQCLEEASAERYATAVATLTFLTRNDAIRTGSFRSKVPVAVKQETIYIGKNISKDDKFKQITKLCQLLQIKPQTILWKDGNSIIFEY